MSIETLRDFLSNTNFWLLLQNPSLFFEKYLDIEISNIEFSVIIGEDNFDNLHRWEGYEEIISKHRILVYPRRVSSPNIPPPNAPNKGGKTIVGEDQVVVFTEAPMIAISSSYIREAILKKQDIQYLLSLIHI